MAFGNLGFEWVRTRPYVCGSTAPAWCSWMPFADYAYECRVPTPGEIRECQRREFGPAMPPDKIEEALRRGDESVAAYCRMHPEECAEYYGLPSPATNWALVAVVVGAIAAASLLLGRR